MPIFYAACSIVIVCGETDSLIRFRANVHSIAAYLEFESREGSIQPALAVRWKSGIGGQLTLSEPDDDRTRFGKWWSFNGIEREIVESRGGRPL